MIFKKNNYLKKPFIINKVFSDTDFENLKKHISDNQNKMLYDDDFNRYAYNSRYLLENFNKKLEPLAKKIFKDNTLESSYCLYVKYQGNASRLEKHKDKNANNYLIDVCISEKTSWPIFIEGSKYVLKENQGLAFLPMEWEHWRSSFPDPENNVVEIIMFYFCPKDDSQWINLKDVLMNNYIEDAWENKDE